MVLWYFLAGKVHTDKPGSAVLDVKVPVLINQEISYHRDQYSPYTAINNTQPVKCLRCFPACLVRWALWITTLLHKSVDPAPLSSVLAVPSLQAGPGHAGWASRRRQPHRSLRYAQNCPSFLSGWIQPCREGCSGDEGMAARAAPRWGLPASFPRVSQ